MTGPLSHESLADIPEGDLVHRILSDSHWRSRILRIDGIPEASVYREVPLDGLGAQGDIDILVSESAIPECATGIQVKRVKVSANTFQTGKPNRVSALPELHRQANLLVQLGFWQVFSYVLVVVDSRAQNKGAFTFEGLTNELRRTIRNAISSGGLHTHAGLIEFELAQPMDDYPLGTGTFFSRIHRMPTPTPQSEAVTKWLRKTAGNFIRA